MIENINRGIEENALVALNKYDIQKDFNKKKFSRSTRQLYTVKKVPKMITHNAP